MTKSRIVRKGWFNREVTEYYNELVNAPKQEKDCCEGFVRNGPYCDPHCDGTCENGKCIGNNVCECYQGYMKFSASLCILECPNCDYGNCIGPEKCDCYDGYTKSDEGTCVPQCNPPCVNVECIAPNKC